MYISPEEPDKLITSILVLFKLRNLGSRHAKSVVRSVNRQYMFWSVTESKYEAKRNFYAISVLSYFRLFTWKIKSPYSFICCITIHLTRGLFNIGPEAVISCGINANPTMTQAMAGYDLFVWVGVATNTPTPLHINGSQSRKNTNNIL